MGDRDDTTRVVKLRRDPQLSLRRGRGTYEAYQIEQKSIPAAADGIFHPSVRHRRRCVWRCQKKVQPSLVLPPTMPSCFIFLSPCHKLPLVKCAFLVKILQQARPDAVAPSVFHPEVVEILQGSRDGHVEIHLPRARVVPFTGAEEGAKRFASVRV